jgi:hypothetical protein
MSTAVSMSILVLVSATAGVGDGWHSDADNGIDVDLGGG